LKSLTVWALRNSSSGKGSISRSARWLVPLVYAFCAIAFVTDITRSNELAYGVFYIPLIATALLHRSRHGLWVLVALAFAMVAIGASLPVVDPDLPDLIGNRFLSIIAILTTACFVDQARRTQERLRAEQRRAEAAEQVKGDLLANLSEEMRTPLHALVSLMNLMLPGARPDQTEALLRIRSSGQHLVGTINNLIDLAQLDERTFAPQRMDLSGVVAGASAEVAAISQDRGITVRVMPSPEAWVMADPWATRRIVENLLAYLIQTSPDGEILTVSLRRQGRDVLVYLAAGPVDPAPSAAQPWMAMDGQAWSSEPLQDTVREPTGMLSAGLTLAYRLAHLMDGTLTVPPEPEEDQFVPAGHAICLSLPAA
jgi:signal transduction histidine kinase